MTDEAVCAAVIGRVLLREGGVVELPGEGFVTRWGQTPGWLEEYRLPTPTTIDEAAENYRVWLSETQLEKLCTVDDALTDVVIDFAVHSGTTQAIRALQAAIGTIPDGVWGLQTDAALAVADRAKAARSVVADRLRKLGALIGGNPARYAKFAKGWLRRVAEQVEALA